MATSPIRQGLVVAAASLLVATNVLGLTYNTTASLPTGIYQIRDLPAAPARGDVVGFCLVGEVARLALARGYVHPEGLEPIVYGKRCRDGVGAIGKPIAGIPGDTVELTPTAVRINGSTLERSRIPSHDRLGRPLVGISWGRTVLRPGEYWLQSQYAENSYDSRLYGSVRIGDMLDQRVLVLEAPPRWILLLLFALATGALVSGRHGPLVAERVSYTTERP